MTRERKFFSRIFGRRDPVTGKRKRKPRLMVYSMLSFVGFSLLLSIAWPVMATYSTIFLVLLNLDNDILIAVIVVFLVIQYICAVLTFIWLFAYLMNQKVMEPIHSLTTGLRKITSGDRSARLTGRINVEFEEMQDAFNYMAGQLEEAERIKQDYERERSMIFSNISHDLKTPISTIAGYAGALSDGLVTDDDKKAEYLRAIRAKALHMNELVELLFEYSRLDNPEYTIRRERLELTELLRGTAATMYGEFENQSVMLDVDLPDESVRITGDRLELSRAVNNLLNNAILHNGPGHRVRIRLVKRTGPAATNVKANAAEDASGGGPSGFAWEIEISDDGAPIPEELAARLFTPFVVGDESRSTRGGSGLGLAITRKIIERHGGCVLLRQGPEGYTKTFAILLPAEETADQPGLPAKDLTPTFNALKEI